MSTNLLFAHPYHEIGNLAYGMALKDNLARLRKREGLSQQDLANKIGVRQNTIAAIETGDTKKTRYLADIARVLKTTVDELDPPSSEAEIIPGVELTGRRDWPIYASVEGGAGQIIRLSDPIDWAPRPAPVANVRGAYGLIVVGESMLPEYRPGETAIVDPNLPLIGGEIYIFYSEKDGEARATIKELRRYTVDTWHVHQHNPRRDFTLSRREWHICHRVLGKYARR